MTRKIVSVHAIQHQGSLFPTYLPLQAMEQKRNEQEDAFLGCKKFRRGFGPLRNDVLQVPVERYDRVFLRKL